MQRGSALVRDTAALAELTQMEELQERALRLDEEIANLLAPLKSQLSALVIERDRLAYEAMITRQKFFETAKKADPNLRDHRSLHFQKRGEGVYIVWDDTGPRFSDEEGAELPRLHVYERRGPGRRAIDLLYRLG